MEEAQKAERKRDRNEVKQEWTDEHSLNGFTQSVSLHDTQENRIAGLVPLWSDF